MPEHGPFASEREASQTEAVRAVYAAFDADPGPGKMRPHNLAMLTAACEETGVELGAYDLRKVEWLGTWEPQTCVVIAGLIRRAHKAGRAAAIEGMVTEWGACRSGEDEPFAIGPDEATVRQLAADLPNAVTALVRRKITVWKEAD